MSFISLGLHTKPLRIDIWPGLVVGITIPLVLAITFVTMLYWGVGLHKISLGSLIIALGLLVDDAIIAVEMMVRKLEEGYDKMRAATFAYDVTAMPMLTGTLITAAGFLPIGLARSTVGEYTFAIFAVTSAALVISWLVSVYFVPYLGAALLRTKSRSTTPAKPTNCSTRRSTRASGAMVNWCVQHRWITIGLTLLTFALGLAGMGRVQQQFFPDSSRPEILVDLWLPEGSTIQETEAMARRFEARMMKEPGARHRQHLDRLGRAALLSAAGPDLSADQRHRRASCWPRTSSSARPCASACRPCWPRSSPRCAAASSCCPTGRRCLTRCSSV